MAVENNSLVLAPEKSLSIFLEKVYAEKGWDFRNYKKMSLLRRISKRVHAAGVKSLDEYCRLVDSDPAEYGKLFSTITIKVSEFFREPEAYQTLGAILKNEFASTGLKAWCCGCAYGQEAYSLGMLFSECLGPEALAASKILATDIDFEALEYARKGAYREDSIVNVSPEFRGRYFIPSDGQHKVKYTIRNMVKFGVLDIVRSHSIPGVNVLFCRNLFIYFSKQLQEEVFRKLDYSLKPGGILVMGKAEVLPGPYAENYTPIGDRVNVFRKRPL